MATVTQLDRTTWRVQLDGDPTPVTITRQTLDYHALYGVPVTARGGWTEVLKREAAAVEAVREYLEGLKAENG